MPGELKIALLGLAHLHPRTYMPHFRATPGLTVVAASDASPAQREGFGREFGIATHADWRELLAKESVDLAYLFLPHAECEAAAVACAEKGIHVVAEKPVTHTAAAARRVHEACRSRGVLFSTPYLWRYHPVCREMKRIIDAGFLGRIVGCEGRCAAGGLHRYLEAGAGWMLRRAESGGGPMYNLGVHWIDLFRWLLGSEIAEVLGRNVKVNAEYDIEDNSFAIATFASGTTLALDISYTVPDSYPFTRDLYLGIRGTEGCINFTPAFEGTRQSLFVCSNHPGFGGSPRRTVQFELDAVPGYCGSLGLEYVREIARNVREKQAPFIGGVDAVRALDVVEAIYESAENGRAAKVRNG